MQDIPRVVLSEIMDSIGDQIKSQMIKYLYKDEEENASVLLEDYIKTLVSTVFFEDDIVDFSEIKNTYHRRRQLTKKNWYNALKSDLDKNKHTPIHDEMKILERLLERKQGNENIKELFSTEDPSELIDIRLSEIEAWATNKSSNLADYPYLETKKQYQLEKAFETDIIYIVSDFLKDSPSKWITERANQMIEVSSVFDVSHKVTQGNLMVNPESKKTVLYDQYKLSNDKLIISILQPDESDEIVLDKMTLLDEKDSSILQITLDSRGERFYKEKKIAIDLRDIVREVYKSESNKAYDLAKKRLMKIGQFSIEGRVLNQNKEAYREFLFNFFQSVDIIKDPATGRVYAEITFSDFLQQQYIDKQTVQIYSHLIKRLENPISRLLVYAFQKERMDAYLQGREPRRFFDYNYFHDRIRFRSKRLESNLKTIQTSLQEFKDLHVLVGNYKRNGNGFDIELHPITDDEKEDFFSAASLQLLEG
ncbi:hypothetical protein ACFVS2_21705 [Brevibacillus sp. NPDC058079]|uniref:hypothetical protein n=1 Tax=Brevibacillus sp. NPDC058079 TaxID=3346330 RepID=UPI0036EAB3CB